MEDNWKSPLYIECEERNKEKEKGNFGYSAYSIPKPLSEVETFNRMWNVMYILNHHTVPHRF
jgi:hypothetical protein